MSIDQIFQVVNAFVLLGWIPLFLFPKWQYTILASRVFVILPLSFVYAFFVITSLGNFDPQQFSTLAGVKELFAKDTAVLVGWIHYLAFDLFVGTYIVSKANKISMNRFLYTICLPFTFMFGPIGYLLFMMFRVVSIKKESKEIEVV